MKHVGANIALKLAWFVALAAPFANHLALATGRYWPLAAAMTAIQLLVIGRAVLLYAGSAARAWLLLLPLALVSARLIGPAFIAPGLITRASLVAVSALSHAGLYLSLLALFGSSLQPGRQPLVTALAQRLRGPLSPEIAGYTRGVTWLWCSYFAAQIAVSAGLLLFAPIAAWSLFVNVLDAPLLVLVFALEFCVRLWRFPHERHISPMAIVRTFRHRHAG